MSRYLSPKEKRIKREQDNARQIGHHDYMSHTKPDERAKKTSVGSLIMWRRISK